MEKYCLLCGKVITDGENCGCLSHIAKKMCINCASCKEDDEGQLTCMNETNLNKTKEKMQEAAKAISAAYEISSFEIKPLPLKKPLLKCANWTLHDDVRSRLVGMIDDLFE